MYIYIYIYTPVLIIIPMLTTGYWSGSAVIDLYMYNCIYHLLLCHAVKYVDITLEYTFIYYLLDIIIILLICIGILMEGQLVERHPTYTCCL